MVTLKQAQEREEFVRVFAEEAELDSYRECERIASLILRHAKTHARYCELECSDVDWTESEEYQKRAKQLDRRLETLAKEAGVSLRLDGDPRGYTIKLLTPRTKKYNTWGGEECGWGVPGS